MVSGCEVLKREELLYGRLGALDTKLPVLPAPLIFTTHVETRFSGAQFENSLVKKASQLRIKNATNF
jgi:hypothetical protein